MKKLNEFTIKLNGLESTTKVRCTNNLFTQTMTAINLYVYFYTLLSIDTLFQNGFVVFR